MYWEDKDDVKNEMISKNIHRKTFDNFMSYIQVADSENLPPDSKVARVKNYLDELKRNFKKYFIREKEYSIDEAMIEYFGRYGSFIKQSIMMKPIRFGYKVWCVIGSLWKKDRLCIEFWFRSWNGVRLD